MKDSVEAKILNSINKIKKQGWVIIANCTITPYKQACPIGAVLLDHNDTKRYHSLRSECSSAADILGIKPTDVEAFMCGWDKQSITKTFESSSLSWVNGQRTLVNSDLISAKHYYDLGKNMRDTQDVGEFDL